MKIDDPGKLTTLEEKPFRESVQTWLEQATIAINGNLEITKNLKCELAEVNFRSANAEVNVQHALGRLAIGYIVVRRSAASVVYDGVSKWTQKSVFLRADVVSTAQILIF